MGMRAWPGGKENHKTFYAGTLHELTIWDLHGEDKHGFMIEVTQPEA